MLDTAKYEELHKIVVERAEQDSYKNNVFYGGFTENNYLVDATWWGCQGSMPNILNKNSCQIVFHVVTNRSSFGSSKVNNELFKEFIFNEEHFPFCKELWDKICIIYHEKYTTIFFDQTNLKKRDKDNLGSHFIGLCLLLRLFGEWDCGPTIKKLISEGLSFREALFFAVTFKTSKPTYKFTPVYGGHTPFTYLQNYNWLFTGKANKHTFHEMTLYSNIPLWSTETRPLGLDKLDFNPTKTEQRILEGRFSILYRNEVTAQKDPYNGEKGINRLKLILKDIYKENGITV